jgi:hypothetical protein
LHQYTRASGDHDAIKAGSTKISSS